MNRFEFTSFYNKQRKEFYEKHSNIPNKRSDLKKLIKESLTYDTKQISWNDSDFSAISNDELIHFDQVDFRVAIYRPFFKQHLNFARKFNHRVFQLPKVFPSPESENLIMSMQSLGSASDFQVVISNCIPDLNKISPTICYPLWKYSENSPEENSLFDSLGEEERSLNIDPNAISLFEKTYGKKLTDYKDIFYYVYGILHNKEYKLKFKNDLKKEIARIPLVENFKDFNEYVKAGHKLAELHVNYESVEPWSDLHIKYSDDWDPVNPDAYSVQKMKYGKKGKETDKSIVIYNSKITISNIPDSAHDYKLGSRSAIDWILDRYQVKTDKASGILNDPNDWAEEQESPTYIFDLIQRIVTVSMKTNEIVAGLPKLKF